MESGIKVYKFNACLIHTGFLSLAESTDCTDIEEFTEADLP